MESIDNQNQEIGVPQNVLDQAAYMLAKKQGTAREAASLFLESGLNQQDAETLAYQLESDIRQALKDRGNKDMLYGALWCVGGTVATLANIGFIFWGAILFGAIQFISGAIKVSKV